MFRWWKWIERGEGERGVKVGDPRIILLCQNGNTGLWIAAVLNSCDFSELSLSPSNDFIFYHCCFLQLLATNSPNYSALLHVSSHANLYPSLTMDPACVRTFDNIEFNSCCPRTTRILWVCWRMKVVVNWENKTWDFELVESTSSLSAWLFFFFFFFFKHWGFGQVFRWVVHSLNVLSTVFQPSKWNTIDPLFRLET